jgi:hypothetical protein
MISEVNTQALLRCIRNNEEARGFDLSNWVHDCGTYGCLVGNDLLACGVPRSDWHVRTYAAAGRHYGLSSLVAQYLFGVFEYKPGPYGFTVYKDGMKEPVLNGAAGFRDATDREAALKRLRKAAYYFMHKKEMLYDDSGRIRETARRAEGDHHVCRKVKQAVERRDPPAV